MLPSVTNILILFPGATSQPVVEIECQADRVTQDLWISLMVQDGFLLIYRVVVEGGSSSRSFSYLARAPVLNEMLLRQGETSNIPRKFAKISQVSKKHNGYFVTGDSPFAVFFNQGKSYLSRQMIPAHSWLNPV